MTERERDGYGLQRERDRPRGREVGVERESNNQIKWLERERACIKMGS